MYPCLENFGYHIKQPKLRAYRKIYAAKNQNQFFKIITLIFPNPVIQYNAFLSLTKMSIEKH